MIRQAKAFLALTVAVCAGCQTIQGADSAFLNLVGPSTQSRVSGHYLATEDVRQYYHQPRQQAGNQRLGYDGRLIPASETRQHNLVDIPLMQAWLDAVVARLGKGWPGELPPMKVRLIDSYAFGPYADNQGNLMVPLGMLDNVESEDEVAAMLGHEMSHVLLHHHDRLAAFKEQKAMVTTMASTVMLGAYAAGTKLDRHSDDVKFVSKNPAHLQKVMGKTVLYSALINTFSDNVWSTAWGRTQEDQADLLGTDLMIRAGYAPRAASHSLQRLNDFQGQQAPLLDSFLSERKSNLQAALGQLDLNGVTQEINVWVSQGVTTGLLATSQYLTRSHLSPLDRDMELRTYLQREYRTERRGKVNRDAWSRIRNLPAVVASLQGYKDAYAASAALEQHKPREAEAFIRRALASPVKDQPGIRRNAFAVHLELGNPRDAEKDLQAIRDWTLAGPSTFDAMIAWQLKKGDATAALATIDQAERSLGSEELFITERLMAHKQLQDSERMASALKTCDRYPSRKAQCRKLVPTAI